MRISFRLQAILACLPLLIVLWTGKAWAVDTREIFQNAQAFGSTSDGQSAAVITNFLTVSRDGVVTIQDQQLIVFVEGQGSFFVNGQLANAVTFDFSKGIVNINAVVPGCGGVFLTLSGIPDDTVERTFRSETKGVATATEKSISTVLTRSLTNATGTVCGRTLAPTVFNFSSLTDRTGRSVEK